MTLVDGKGGVQEGHLNTLITSHQRIAYAQQNLFKVEDDMGEGKSMGGGNMGWTDSTLEASGSESYMNT